MLYWAATTVDAGCIDFTLPIFGREEWCIKLFE